MGSADRGVFCSPSKKHPWDAARAPNRPPQSRRVDRGSHAVERGRSRTVIAPLANDCSSYGPVGETSALTPTLSQGSGRLASSLLHRVMRRSRFSSPRAATAPQGTIWLDPLPDDCRRPRQRMPPPVGPERGFLDRLRGHGPIGMEKDPLAVPEAGYPPSATRSTLVPTRPGTRA